ncbi:hypothetical protein GEMRC1_004457 [Eukaryota sp. GEM-RC1]
MRLGLGSLSNRQRAEAIKEGLTNEQITERYQPRKLLPEERSPFRIMPSVKRLDLDSDLVAGFFSREEINAERKRRASCSSSTKGTEKLVLPEYILNNFAKYRLGNASSPSETTGLLLGNSETGFIDQLFILPSQDPSDLLKLFQNEEELNELVHEFTIHRLVGHASVMGLIHSHCNFNFNLNKLDKRMHDLVGQDQDEFITVFAATIGNKETAVLHLQNTTLDLRRRISWKLMNETGSSIEKCY